MIACDHVEIKKLVCDIVQIKFRIVTSIKLTVTISSRPRDSSEIFLLGKLCKLLCIALEVTFANKAMTAISSYIA